MHQFILFLCILTYLGFAEQPYRKLYPFIDLEAKCLDGSPGALYIHSGSEKDKILIFAYGGGTCIQQTLSASLQSCYQRSQTKLGSSYLWPDQIIGQGYLSTDPTKNKFANWTKVLFPYCDGTGHQGYRKSPIEYKGIQLFFRGSAVTRQNFNWVNDHLNLSSATKILMTGVSAGAVATYNWVNYLRKMVKDPSIIDAVVDSGLFVASNSYINKKPMIQLLTKNLYSIANVDEKTPSSSCNQRYPGEQWRCIMLQYAYLSIQGRVLLIDSQYDSWQFLYFNELGCPQPSSNGYTLSYCNPSQLSYAETVRNLRVSVLRRFISDPNHSVWSIACSNHVYVSNDRFYNNQNIKVPMYWGDTVQTVVQKFVFNKQRINLIDTVSYPNNAPCA